MTKKEIDDLINRNAHESVRKIMHASHREVVQIGGKRLRVLHPQGWDLCRRCTGRGCPNCIGLGETPRFDDRPGSK